MKQTLAVLLAITLLSTNVLAAVSKPVLKSAKSTVWLKIKVQAEFENKEGKIETKTGWGGCSGTFISEHVILTAAHCVTVPENMRVIDLWIQNFDGSSERASILRKDVKKDLAILATEKSHNYVKLAKSRSLGQDITIIGCPLGIPHVITKGIISKLNFMFEKNGTKHFVTDTSILPGNSGGGVFNNDGELVGVVVRSTSMFGGFGAVGIGFVVELSEIKEFLKI